MATATRQLIPSAASDAAFRAWGSGISEMLSEVGLVRTTDTGQVNWTTVTLAGAGSTLLVRGYEVYRFNDALQASRPLFLKVEYGANANGASSGVAIWFSVGTTTDGAGNLGGLSTTRRVYSMHNSTVTYEHAAAGDGSYLSLSLASGAPPGLNVVYGGLAAISIERSRNADGTVNNDSAYILSVGSSHTNATTPGGTPAAACDVITYEIATVYNNTGVPIAWGPVPVGTFETDVMFTPVMMNTPKFQGMPLGVLGYYTTTITARSPVVVPVNGINRTYYPTNVGGADLGTGFPAASQAAATADHRVALRYE